MGWDNTNDLQDWQDPKLWMVACSPGKEQEVCVQLLRKFFKAKAAGKPLLIKSVVANPPPRTMMGKSYIYVEAHKITHVQEAIKGIHNLQYGQWTQTMMKKEDVPSIMQVIKPKRPIKKGDWVRLRSAPYKGDVAKVFDVSEQEGKIGVQVVPRIDFKKYEQQDGSSDGGRKKKKRTRPPQRLFNPQDVTDLQRRFPNVDVPDVISSGFEDEGQDHVKYEFGGKDYVDGFLILQIKSDRVDYDSIKPSLDELRMFERASSDSLVEDVSEASTNPFKKGDKVEVKEGDLINLNGVVLSVNGREVLMQPDHDVFKDALPFDYSSLRKAFKSSDHVKVIGGSYEGETGLVVKISDDDIISIVSDLSMKEIRVRASDLQLATEQSTGLDSHGQFELHDLVQLDLRNVGVVIRIERDMLFVLDQDGQDRQVKPVQVQSLSKRRPGTTMDNERNEVRKASIVKVTEGQHKSRNGKVLHVWKSSVFVYRREIMENNGVFVVRNRHLKVAGGTKRAMDGPRVPQSPMIHGRGRGAAAERGRGGRGGGRGNRKHELIGKTIRVTRGVNKGAMGLVRDATNDTVKVELQANPKQKIFNMDIISVVNDDAFSKGSYQSGSFQFSGSQTPIYGSNTPSYGSKTPTHGGATPHYGGGATPGYDGNATPSRGDATPGPASGSAWDPKQPNTPGAEDTPGGGGWDAAQTPGDWGNPDSVYTESPYNPGTAEAYGTPAAEPTPGTPGIPSTPSAYDYSATPQDAYAGTPQAYGAYDPTGTPSGEVMTPSNTYTPGTPAGAYTPSGGGAAGPGATWHRKGVVVSADGREGTIVEVMNGSDECAILFSGGDTAVYKKSALVAVPPSEKDDKVIVLSKEYAGHIGVVRAFEGMEVIVTLTLQDGAPLVRIIEKDILSKFVEV